MDCSRYKLVTQSIGKQLPRSSNQSEERCMDGTTLQQYARNRAEELPQTIMGYPFGPDYEVYKIRGKVVMLLTDVTGEPIVILKSPPDEAQALREAYG